jgi:tyrosine 3-monooxygenase
MFQNFKGVVTHLETRASKQTGMQFDILVKVDMCRQNLLLLIRSLRQSSSLGGVTLLADNSVSIKGKSHTLLAIRAMRWAQTGR